MDMERVDNTASDAQPPVPRGTRNQDPGGYIANCTSGTVNDDPVGCGGQFGCGNLRLGCAYDQKHLIIRTRNDVLIDDDR